MFFLCYGLVNDASYSSAARALQSSPLRERDRESRLGLRLPTERDLERSTVLDLLRETSRILGDFETPRESPRRGDLERFGLLAERFGERE